MKNIFLKSVFTFAILAGITMTAGARSNNTLIYDRLANPQIGITAGNKQAIGRSYTICDEKGKVVMSGTIRSAETFYISTRKLPPGTYTFRIEGDAVQEFTIR